MPQGKGLMRVHPGGKGLEMRQDAPNGPVAPGAAPRGRQRLLEVLLKRARGGASRPCTGPSLPRRADIVEIALGHGAGPAATLDWSSRHTENTGRPITLSR